MWLFDTTFIIDLINADPSAVKKAKTIEEPALKAISVITVQEYLRGIFYLFSSDKVLLDKKLTAAEKELSYFEVIPVDYTIAKLAAEIDAALMVRGQQIGLSDVLIASTAIKYNFTLVTRNVKDFERVADVKSFKIEPY